LKTVTQAISAIDFRGGTAIVDSLNSVADLMTGIEGRNALVLVTDGYDENSTGDVEEALRKLRGTGATMYVIGIGGVAGISLKGERVLRRLAEETGGRVFFPSREEELPSVHELVASDVQKRYLITYTPTNQKVDGTWRRIDLMVQGDYRVRTRPGYFAPMPPPVRPSIEFTMQDRDRRPLEVSRDDLVVLENGVEQTLDTFQEAVTPVSLILALDASGSMKKAADAARAAAREFVDALRPEDKLAVLTFADRVVFAHDLSNVRAWSHEAIDKYQTAGGTALYDALGDSLQRLRYVEGRRAIVVVTDGRDENNAGTGPGSQRRRQDVSDALKQTEATIFTIGIGANVDRDLLAQLSEESGGEAYFPEDVSALGREYRRVVENLRRRYIISYSSTDRTRDGAWRRVEISKRNANVVVKSRGGYFAPAK
jgi:VWFA-related protein